MGNIIRLVAWHIFGKPSVLLIDYDGSPSVRYAHRYGETWIAHRLGFGIRTVILEPEGRIFGDTWVKSWRPVAGKLS